MVADQLALALADRHAGQTANLAAGTKVHADHRADIERAVAHLARRGTPFTADHVHEILFQGYDRNLVSSVMGCWARDGRIREDTDHRPVPSAARSRRYSRNRWWIGGPNIPEARRE